MEKKFKRFNPKFLPLVIFQALLFLYIANNQFTEFDFLYTIMIVLYFAVSSGIDWMNDRGININLLRAIIVVVSIVILTIVFIRDIMIPDTIYIASMISSLAVGVMTMVKVLFIKEPPFVVNGYINPLLQKEFGTKYIIKLSLAIGVTGMIILLFWFMFGRLYLQHIYS